MRMRKRKINAIAVPDTNPKNTGARAEPKPGFPARPTPIAMNSTMVTTASLAKS